MRVRLNALGRQAFKKTPNRTGEYLGESKLKYHPSIMKMPRVRVLWDETVYRTTVLAAYVDIYDDGEE